MQLVACRTERNINNFRFLLVGFLKKMGYNDNFPQMARDGGFKLRQYRDGPLDWRLMGSYETERILRDQNIELVDSALHHLSEAPLGTVLESNILDSGIAKYFVMSQYAIQYLLYCRTFLDESVSELSEANATAQAEVARLRKSLAESNNEILHLHKKITQIEAIREVVYPCHLCTKNFISNEALNIHIGRKHGGARTRTETPTTIVNGGAIGKDKDNDIQLINTIKMELEIKQLKERLNAAERNIKERSSGGTTSKKHSPREESSKAAVRTVGIQSNLEECKEKDELSSEALDSEASERKEQLHGLAERISSFESWQTQLKQSNEQFILDINQKLEGLAKALEQTKQRTETKPTSAPTSTTTMTSEDRVATPCLEDLERILTEKVTEIGRISANKLEEVVYHLEMGYKDKLEALERELKRLSARKDPPVLQTHTSISKIPKPLPTTKPKEQETSMERIKREVENEFLKAKADDDTFSIEEPNPTDPQANLPIKEFTQVQEIQSGSSGSQHTYTKSPAKLATTPTKLELSKPKTTAIPVEAPEATDISESLSEEETDSERNSKLFTSKPEREVLKPKIRSSPRVKSPQKPKQPFTRKDARRLVNRKLNPHGFDMKSKTISHISMKRVNAELAEHRNKLKLQHPHFYATRNRIRKFVEKLCSVKLPQSAEMLLKHKTPLQPIEAPKRTQLVSSVTDDDEEAEESEAHDEATSDQSVNSSSEQRPSRDFKAHLEKILVKSSGRATSASSKPLTMVQMQQESSRPVPLPRKRVMFSAFGNGKTMDESDGDFK
ncbi:zinc finger protein DZIP1L [Scaptodrosophila lebanonensis]|uniref:Zinc finger protein DZIP1L n=1 Tax=Drosophila lebanonensis TaxID=7225 RepID=A0A6J2TM59_DROLE|nr:zinc finger protein DZIP1L [Scaptodrosophila lebanonensis]